jgi:hypothetical protein
MSALRTYNVEAWLPTLDEARRLVIEEIKRAKCGAQWVAGPAAVARWCACGVVSPASAGRRRIEMKIGSSHLLQPRCEAQGLEEVAATDKGRDWRSI